jgi:adenine deaminase
VIFLNLFEKNNLMQHIQGQIIDIEEKKIYSGRISFDGNGISKIEHDDHNIGQYILPGFIDAHVHIESSMLTPAEFARLAVPHGTVATVSDPHEIANVMGIEGVKYMIENSSTVNFKVFFGAPSCVPATRFETAGAVITPEDIEILFRDYSLKYLSEMMNWPGVLNKDPEVMQKIAIARKYGVPVDGHAPGLVGENAIKYINSGISTDHECYRLEEAIHKLKNGMKVIIREGSAARNFEELYKIIFDYPDQVMFCSDDKHPDELVEGHINILVKRALLKGADLFDVLKIACTNPVNHYDLDVGRLKEGDPADFIVVDDLRQFNVLQTYINGQLVAEKGRSLIPRVESSIINHFSVESKSPNDFSVKPAGEEMPVIEARDQQIVTGRSSFVPEKDSNGFVAIDIKQDILKITVVNRYSEEKPAVGFIRNFGLKDGAIASSVAHDSHNIIAVGVSDEHIARAVNLIIEHKGGISAVSKNKETILPLPVAGLLSNEDGYKVAERYKALDRAAKDLGSNLSSPFMTLSFMALLVIPSLKLSDKGLFDGEKFDFVNQ